MKRKTIKQKISLLAAIPILAFVSVLFVWNRLREVDVAKTMYLNVALTKSASSLITEIQGERGILGMV